MCLSVTLRIFDLWQYCVCCIRSGAPGCTFLILHFLDHMCQCGLHEVPWLHSGILMHCLAAEPRSTSGLLFSSQYPSGTIMLTPYSMVWDWQVSRAAPMFFYWPKQLYPYYCHLYFSLSLLPVYKLVLWTDKVYITLSQHCTADLFQWK